MVAPWPDMPVTMIDAGLEKRFERLQETIIAVRNVRSVYGIAPGAPLKLFMRCAPDVAEQLKAVAGQFDFLSKTMLEAAGLDVTAPTGSVSFSLPDADGYIPVGDSINRDEVRKNKEKEAENSAASFLVPKRSSLTKASWPKPPPTSSKASARLWLNRKLNWKASNGSFASCRSTVHPSLRRRALCSNLAARERRQCSERLGQSFYNVERLSSIAHCTGVMID